VREAESMASTKVLTVKRGCQAKILEYGKTSNNRVKVLVNGEIGWVTILHATLPNLLQHEPLFAKRRPTF